MAKKKNEISIRSSATEYLTYVASVGNQADSFEMRYQDENIWLTQKMMATLDDVSVSAINQHLKRIFEDGELVEDSVIKKYLTTAAAVYQRRGSAILKCPSDLSFGGYGISTVCASTTPDRKSTRLNSSHRCTSRMPSSA